MDQLVRSLRLVHGEAAAPVDKEKRDVTRLARYAQIAFGLMYAANGQLKLISALVNGAQELDMRLQPLGE